jgi:hypothetical protein
VHRGERRSWAIRSIGAGEAGEQVLGFRTDKDDVEAFGFAGARGLDRLSDFPSEDLAIEEKDSLEDPMLGRGSDVFVESQVGEKGFDFLSAHFWGGVGVYHEIRMKRHHLACPVQEFRGDGRTGRFWRFGWTLDTTAPLCYATHPPCPYQCEPPPRGEPVAMWLKAV